MRLFIEPTEPMLFRTGRPFNAGENNFAETIFPPTPETFQGALRAMIAVQWGKDRADKTRTLNELFNEDEVVKLIGKREGDRNVYGRFRITGLTLGRYDAKTEQVSRLFPAPAHIIKAIVEEDGRQTSVRVQLRPKKVEQGLSNYPLETQLLFTPDLEGKKTVGKSEPLEGWLTPLGLQRALSKEGFPESDAQEKQPSLIPTHAIYQRESRLGIGMNSATKTTEEGYLYQVQMIRMKQDRDFRHGFVVDIELGQEKYGSSELSPADDRPVDALQTPPELAFLQEGWLTMGGEQRAARFKVLDPKDIAEEAGISRTTTGNLLYFATPAYFQNGWIPATPNIFQAQPITAAIKRYQPIGGWLLNPGNAGGASKRTRRCIPAGSVYYFDRPVSATQALTEYGWQIGYGIAYTGEYKA